MEEQLIKKDCSTGEYSDIFPITTLNAVLNEKGETLTSILECYNHLFLPYINNSSQDTRLQVPKSMRRRGLWITYIKHNKEVITEWYNSADFADDAFKLGNNWVRYLDYNYINSTIRRLLLWYKA